MTAAPAMVSDKPVVVLERCIDGDSPETKVRLLIVPDEPVVVLHFCPPAYTKLVGGGVFTGRGDDY
jgi:hypothetical protein